MYSDPEKNCYLLERRKIRNKQGCSTCQHSFKAWGGWHCKKGQNKTKGRNFCKFWRFNQECE